VLMFVAGYWERRQTLPEQSAMLYRSSISRKVMMVGSANSLGREGKGQWRLTWATSWDMEGAIGDSERQ